MQRRDQVSKKKSLRRSSSKVLGKHVTFHGALSLSLCLFELGAMSLGCFKFHPRGLWAVSSFDHQEERHEFQHSMVESIETALKGIEVSEPKLEV